MTVLMAWSHDDLRYDSIASGATSVAMKYDSIARQLDIIGMRIDSLTTRIDKMVQTAVKYFRQSGQMGDG